MLRVIWRETIRQNSKYLLDVVHLIGYDCENREINLNRNRHSQYQIVLTAITQHLAYHLIVEKCKTSRRESKHQNTLSHCVFVQVNSIVILIS